MAGDWPWADEARLAGLLHDLGKYGDSFQARLRGDETGVDHWSIGALEAFQSFKALGAALAIEGHHVGLQPASKVAERLGQTLQGRSPFGPNLRLSDFDRMRLCSVPPPTPCSSRPALRRPCRSSKASGPPRSAACSMCGCCSRAWSMPTSSTPRLTSTAPRRASSLVHMARRCGPTQLWSPSRRTGPRWFDRQPAPTTMCRRFVPSCGMRPPLRPKHPPASSR